MGPSGPWDLVGRDGPDEAPLPGRPSLTSAAPGAPRGHGRTHPQRQRRAPAFPPPSTRDGTADAHVMSAATHGARVPQQRARREAAGSIWGLASGREGDVGEA